MHARRPVQQMLLMAMRQSWCMMTVQDCCKQSIGGGKGQCAQGAAAVRCMQDIGCGPGH